MKTKTRILLADDHPIFRDGLRQAILSDPSMEIVAEASDGESALRSIQELRPEIAVLDISMPKLSGLLVARQVRKQNLPVQIVFITMHNEEDVFNQALDAGAKGFVLKESAVSDILDAIRAAAQARFYLSPSVSHYLVERGNRKDKLTRGTPGLDDLTSGERQVLKLISEDRSTKEIADDLGVSPRTIEAHRANICDKLNLHGSHSLLRFAFDHRAQL
jgi:DNA-binding NarL/FixJ family response regulator